MKILVVISFYKPAYAYGGLVRSVPALCEGLVRRGCDVTVFTTNANGSSSLDVPVSTPQDIDGVKVIYYPTKKGALLYTSTALDHACRREIPKFGMVYVVSTWAFPFIAACRSAARARIPYVVSPRTAFMRSTWAGTFAKKMVYHLVFERALINRAAAIHYTSELELKESTWLRLKRPPLVVPNPVEIDDFATLPPRGVFRQRYGLGTDDKIALYLGRVEPRKGLELTILALARLAGRYRNLKFVIVGPEEDDHVAALKRLAREHGVGDRVLFTGMLLGSARLSAFSDADLFVLTSKGENFAMAAVEAMASGLPVILSDAVGVAPGVAAARAGIIVRQDEDEIAAAIERLVASPETATAMGKVGRTHARSAYHPDAVAGQWLEGVRTVCVQPGTGFGAAWTS